MMHPTNAERCDGCGTLLDDRTAVRLDRDRVGWSFCVDCYLHRDLSGRPRDEGTPAATIYRVQWGTPDLPSAGPPGTQQAQHGLWIDVGGEAVNLDDEFVTGADIKRAARVASDSLLLIRGEERSYVVGNDDRILVRPDDRFDSLPAGRESQGSPRGAPAEAPWPAVAWSGPVMRASS
jgi:hypothetical protein